MNIFCDVKKYIQFLNNLYIAILYIAHVYNCIINVYINLGIPRLYYSILPLWYRQIVSVIYVNIYTLRRS